MALLQIAEPGLSAAPHQHRLAVGIDLRVGLFVATIGVAVVLGALAGFGASGGLAFLSSGSDTEMAVPRPSSL